MGLGSSWKRLTGENSTNHFIMLGRYSIITGKALRGTVKNIKVGNSSAVIIPAHLFNKPRPSTRDDIVTNEQQDSSKMTKSKLSDSFQEVLAEALDKYRGALEDLRRGDE